MKRIFALFAILAVAPLAQALVDYPEPISLDAAKNSPYTLVGQLLFRNGRSYYGGSGTVIMPRSVITAGHNVFDPDTGWSTNMMFRRGLNGDTYLSKQYGKRLYALAGYRGYTLSTGSDSLPSFSHDTGAVVFTDPVAGGLFAPRSMDRNLLTSNAFKVAAGYGAEWHSGDDMLIANPARFYQVWGAFYETRSMYAEKGMSGGPVFADDGTGKLVVVATVVASSLKPVTGGVRVLNPQTERFITGYLP